MNGEKRWIYLISSACAVSAVTSQNCCCKKVAMLSRFKFAFFRKKNGMQTSKWIDFCSSLSNTVLGTDLVLLHLLPYLQVQNKTQAIINQIHPLIDIFTVVVLCCFSWRNISRLLHINTRLTIYSL